MGEYKPLIPILVEALESVYSKKRSGYHVSDVLICPTERVFQDIDPLPKTMRELNFFTSGRAVHEAYETLFTSFPNRFNEQEVWLSRSTGKVFKIDQKEGLSILHETKTLRNMLHYAKLIEDEATAKKIEEFIKDMEVKYEAYLVQNGINPYEDIVAHVDLYDAMNNQPYEAKSSRTAGLKSPKDFHVDQLQYYMALLDSEYGGVFYQFLNHFDDKPFAEFPVHMSPEQRKAKLQTLIAKVNDLAKAKEAGDPFMVQGVLDNVKLNWKCYKKDYKTGKVEPACPYLDKCLKHKGITLEEQARAF